MVMTILTTNSTQSFPIIPIRQVDELGHSLLVTMTDETTKTVYQRTVANRSSVNDLYYIGFTDLDFLVENTFYSLVVFFDVTNEIIYKDLIFCTNQNIDLFSINNGEYILPSINNNGYITV